jgi:hypothetical protein
MVMLLAEGDGKEWLLTRRMIVEQLRVREHKAVGCALYPGNTTRTVSCTRTAGVLPTGFGRSRYESESRLVNAEISEPCGPHPYVLRSTVRLRAEGRSVWAVLYLQKRSDQDQGLLSCLLPIIIEKSQVPVAHASLSVARWRRRCA